MTDEDPGTSPEAARTVDARGQRCPLPVIALARAVAAAPPGALVRLLADDEAARVDVPAWCRMRGHELVGVRDPDGRTPASTPRGALEFLVRRSVP